MRLYRRKGLLRGRKDEDGRIRFSAIDVDTFKRRGKPFFEPEELNVEQAARELEVRPETVRLYSRKGLLRGRKGEDGRLRFNPIDVDKFKRWTRPTFGPKPLIPLMDTARLAIKKPALGRDLDASLIVGRIALFDELQRAGSGRDEIAWARLTAARKESLMLVRALTLTGAEPKAIATMLGMTTRWIQRLVKQYNEVISTAPPEPITGADRLLWDIPEGEWDDRALQDD